MAAVVALALTAVSAGCTPPVPKERMLRATAANVPKIDPAIGSDGAAAMGQLNIYESLVFPNPDGSVRAHLATKWETSPDGLVWTFTLKQGVKFHSGKELTAADVAFTMDRLLKIGRGWAYLFKGRVEKSEAVDKYTVKFTLTKPFGPFLSTLVRLYVMCKEDVMAHLVTPGSYDEFGDFATTWLQTADAGTGPYKVREVKQGEYVLLEQFAEYFNGFKPNSPTTMKIIGTTEAVTVRTLMSRRELEISDSYQSIEALTALGQISGVTVALLPAATMNDLMLNTKKAPTDDVNFRKALAYAVDYATLVEQISPGTPAPVGLVSSAVAGHNPDVEQPTYDLVKAMEYLKKSKYYGNLDKYPVELAWVAEVPDREKIALLVQASCEQLGITINVVRVPWVSLVDKCARPDTTPHGNIVSMSPDYPEAGAHMYARWHSSGAGTWLQMDWLQSASFDEAIEDALSTTDFSARLEKYKPLQVTLLDLQPAVTLMQGLTRMAYQSSYVTWPAADAAKNNQPVTVLMGYTMYARDIEVFPEKMPK
jgi:peptide/nickel transport system substrate-binding protein